MPSQPSRSASDNLHDPDDEEIDQDLDLPPLDADADDDPAPDEAHDLPDPIDETGGLDDSAAAELDVGDELDEIDDDAGGDAEADVDVGPLDEGIEDDDAGTGPGDDDEGAADEEGLAIDDSRDADDGGAEGTGENPEDQVDEAALPEMDDGEEGGGEQGLADALLSESAGDLPAWAPGRVSLLEGAGAAVPCRSLAVAAGRVAAAGEVLLFVEEGARAARRLPFGEGVVAVALADDSLLAATARGQLLASRDGATEATALGPFRAGVGPLVVQLAATPGRFWIRAGASLFCAPVPPPSSRADGAQGGGSKLLPATPGPKPPPPSSVRERGVLAIAASGGTLVAVTLGPAGPAIERLRGDDEGGMEAPLAGPARSLVERGRDALLLAVAAGGRCLALGDGRSIALSRDGGATFAVLDPGPAVAIAFAGDEAEAPLLALIAPAGAAVAYLVEVSAAGEAARVGELSSAERELPAAIAWDASRELIWVASGAGLVALGLPRRH